VYLFYPYILIFYFPFSTYLPSISCPFTVLSPLFLFSFDYPSHSQMTSVNLTSIKTGIYTPAIMCMGLNGLTARLTDPETPFFLMGKNYKGQLPKMSHAAGYLAKLRLGWAPWCRTWRPRWCARDRLSGSTGPMKWLPCCTPSTEPEQTNKYSFI
jgi:hypothetical protein